MKSSQDQHIDIMSQSSVADVMGLSWSSSIPPFATNQTWLPPQPHHGFWWVHHCCRWTTSRSRYWYRFEVRSSDHIDLVLTFPACSAEIWSLSLSVPTIQKTERLSIFIEICSRAAHRSSKLHSKIIGPIPPDRSSYQNMTQLLFAISPCLHIKEISHIQSSKQRSSAAESVRSMLSFTICNVWSMVWYAHYKDCQSLWGLWWWIWAFWCSHILWRKTDGHKIVQLL